MTTNRITISAVINADNQTTWDCYTAPEHITQWNFADDSWHCPSASNDLRVGGSYIARMEAKDGSFGFDFQATYDEIDPLHRLAYTLGDGRTVMVYFKAVGSNKTEVVVDFAAENTNPIEMQRQGWQAILDNFKKYTEGRG